MTRAQVNWGDSDFLSMSVQSTMKSQAYTNLNIDCGDEEDGLLSMLVQSTMKSQAYTNLNIDCGDEEDGLLSMLVQSTMKSQAYTNLTIDCGDEEAIDTKNQITAFVRSQIGLHFYLQCMSVPATVFFSVGSHHNSRQQTAACTQSWVPCNTAPPYLVVELATETLQLSDTPCSQMQHGPGKTQNEKNVPLIKHNKQVLLRSLVAKHRIPIFALLQL